MIVKGKNCHLKMIWKWWNDAIYIVSWQREIILLPICHGNRQTAVYIRKAAFSRATISRFSCNARYRAIVWFYRWNSIDEDRSRVKKYRSSRIANFSGSSIILAWNENFTLLSSPIISDTNIEDLPNRYETALDLSCLWSIGSMICLID